MWVTDLDHMLDLPEDAPAPARRLAAHLANIVRAATAGDVGTAWETALPCRRRPGNRRCPGRMVVLQTGPETPIRWQCSACDDEGVVSNWEGSPYDLRRERLTVANAGTEVVITADAASALREVLLLDRDCERVVFQARARGDDAVLTVTGDDLDELIGYVAAEANHEPNRRRQRRLDAAFDALSTAAEATEGR